MMLGVEEPRPGEHPGTLGPPPVARATDSDPRAGTDGTAQDPVAADPARPVALAGPTTSGPDLRPPAPPPPRPAWGTRFAVLGVSLFAAVSGWFAATWFLPRWWAHRIGDVSDGTFTAGVFAGLVCGVAFTLFPLLILRAALRPNASWPGRFAVLVLALLVAVPNLITLGIVLGTNNAAHAAERTFDVEAPGFRGATLAGAVVGALAAVAAWVLLWRGRRRKRQVRELKAELARRDTTGSVVAPQDHHDKD
jgi:hypothetical protein